jgi:uncharacterized protein
MNDTQLAALEKKVHLITRPEPALLWLYVISSLAAFCFAPLLLIPLFFRYHTLWYRFESSGVAMGHGILFRREMQLTYARMQDIHLSQNILERWLGIGTVTVQTAGAGGTGNLSIEGVKDFNIVRDYLYAKMRGTTAAAKEASETKVEHHSTDAVLLEIRDALRDAARALDAKRPASASAPDPEDKD